jgi:hypothetical protein
MSREYPDPDPPLWAINIYAPGQPVETVGPDGTLTGGSALPGFSIVVSTLFAQL